MWGGHLWSRCFWIPFAPPPGDQKSLKMCRKKIWKREVHKIINTGMKVRNILSEYFEEYTEWILFTQEQKKTVRQFFWNDFFTQILIKSWKFCHRRLRRPHLKWIQGSLDMFTRNVWDEAMEGQLRCCLWWFRNNSQPQKSLFQVHILLTITQDTRFLGVTGLFLQGKDKPDVM